MTCTRSVDRVLVAAGGWRLTLVTCGQEMLNGTAKVSVTEYDEGGFVINDVVRSAVSLCCGFGPSLCCLLTLLLPAVEHARWSGAVL
jgi:hypothetical protein